MSERRPKWMDKAACRGLDTDIFMPLRGENQKIKDAKQICAECPVQLECRNYGLQLQQLYDTHGIFGGWTRQQRSKELRRLGVTQRRFGSAEPGNMKHDTVAGYLTHIMAGEQPCARCAKHSQTLMVEC